MRKEKIISYTGADLPRVLRIVHEAIEAAEREEVVKIRIALPEDVKGVSPFRRAAILRRRSKGWTQSVFASQIGASQSQIARFENGGGLGFQYVKDTVRFLKVRFRYKHLDSHKTDKFCLHTFFRTVRKMKGVKGSEVSATASVGRSQLSWFENGGAISLSSLERLIKYYGVQID